MRVVTTSDLPPPASNKTDWPWTQEPTKCSETDYDLNPWPKITIVTPSFNQGRFIEETIRSVLLQGYPNLEYIIIDGGSTDDSIDIIKKYEKWLSYWVSEKDEGQAHAINKGIDMATGQWFNWINSDDMLLPNALVTLIKISQIVPDAEWISGGRIVVDKTNSFVDIAIPWRTNPRVIGLGEMDLIQDATFVKLDFVRNHGIRLYDQYNYIFDTVFHFQLAKYSKPLLTSVVFSTMRWHERIKTKKLEQRKEKKAAGLSPFVKLLPLTRRILLRLIASRPGRLLRPIFLFAVVYGVIPFAREWTAVVFDYENCELTEKPARMVLL
jgi:glycosyltransferase involved in cell wall biosynthesis